MKQIDQNEMMIKETVNLYFIGTYCGNAEQLKQAFHPEAHITGSLDGVIYDWKLAEFITRITNQPSPASLHEKYDKEILFLDKTGNAGMVKARVSVGNKIFTDYITLLKIDKRWIIRNKSFST